jgi:5'-methylthioadenosine phosphorylase
MGAEARIAVIGGSGLYRFLEASQAVQATTPYGEPSGSITIAKVSGQAVAFLPRHGPQHTIAPHAINDRANLFALHSLGVERVIAPAAVGSLRPEMAPGDLVICDQLIDRTWGRASTFYDGPEVAHVSMADPYCEELRPLAVAAARKAGFTTHDRGTVLVNQGPRFGTRAEARFHRQIGADLVNMTQYPEVALARELGMCYLNLSLVTDYDAGIEASPQLEPVSQEEVLRVFGENVERLRDALVRIVRALPAARSCQCAAMAAQPLHPAPSD